MTLDSFVCSFPSQVWDISVSNLWCITELMQLERSIDGIATTKITRGILTWLSSVKSSLHLIQSFNRSSSNFSSQWSFSCQVFCKTLFAGNRTGPIIPRGSRIELNVDKHPLLVSFLSCPDDGNVLTPTVSVTTFHYCLRTLSIGSLSRSRFLIVLSSVGWQPIHPWRSKWI